MNAAIEVVAFLPLLVLAFLLGYWWLGRRTEADSHDLHKTLASLLSREDVEVVSITQVMESGNRGSHTWDVTLHTKSLP